MTIILSILNRLKNCFFTGRLLGKLAVIWISKIPPQLAYVATLPCETLLSAKQAINDKLQGSVVTHLRYDGVVNNQIKKGLLLSLRVKKVLKSVNIWQITSKNIILSHALSPSFRSVLAKRINAQENHVLACTSKNFTVFYRPDALPAAQPTASKH